MQTERSPDNLRTNSLRARWQNPRRVHRAASQHSTDNPAPSIRLKAYPLDNNATRNCALVLMARSPAPLPSNMEVVPWDNLLPARSTIQRCSTVHRSRSMHPELSRTVPCVPPSRSHAPVLTGRLTAPTRIYMRRVRLPSLRRAPSMDRVLRMEHLSPLTKLPVSRVASSVSLNLAPVRTEFSPARTRMHRARFLQRRLPRLHLHLRQLLLRHLPHPNRPLKLEIYSGRLT